MLKILLVEDDKDLNLLTSAYLKDAGHTVTSVFNGLDALDKVYEEKYDLVLSDIMMPLCDGFEMAKEIRKFNDEIPIIFMTARDDKPSKQLGYRVGIDDYLVKPVDFDELILKINAIARRLKLDSKDLVVGNLKMNKEEHAAYINEEEINFSVREFDILYAMLSNPKKTFTRGKLMEDFWDYDSSATSRTVDVYLSKLRDKTKTCDGFEIQTVHGLGYKVVLKWKVPNLQ